jgi:hypothetical protein
VDWFTRKSKKRLKKVIWRVVVSAEEELSENKKTKKSKIAINFGFELIKLVRRDWFVISVCEGMGRFWGWWQRRIEGDGGFIKVRGDLKSNTPH